MIATEEASHRRSKQHFIRKERGEIRSLFEPLMPGYVRAALGTENERHLFLREAGAFSICADIVGKSRRGHTIFYEEDDTSGPLAIIVPWPSQIG
jgi:hypothetical protein